MDWINGRISDKKNRSLLNVWLAMILVLTSIGAVFTTETPPPKDDRTLPAPTALIYPANLTTLYYDYGINFIWANVPGAGKYILEVQRYNKKKNIYQDAIPALTIYPQAANSSPVPAATVATEKKLPTDSSYRWRVTAFYIDNNDGSAEPGQPSAWSNFSINARVYSIIDMFPNALASAAGAYSGMIDPQKGDGTQSNTPNLNWVIHYGGSGAGSIGDASSIFFKVTLREGNNVYTKIIPAAGNCADYYFSRRNNEDALCSTDFSNFTPALFALTQGITYTWEVVGVDQPDPTLFPNPTEILPVLKDTLQYNSDSSYPILSEAVVNDSIITNKPSFGWKQPAGGLSEGNAYQLVVEGYNPKITPIVWKTLTAPLILPGETINPDTGRLVCPVNGDTCSWFFTKPLQSNLYYRWNIRVYGAGRYGPWVNPGTPAGPDDMVRDAGLDSADSFMYITKPGLFNYFSISEKPTVPKVIAPLYRSVSSDPYPALSWYRSYVTNYAVFTSRDMSHYQISLTRISPGPLTKTINIMKASDAGDLVCGSSCEITAPNYLPAEYAANGLPRGIYQLTITPKIRLDNGQWYNTSPAVKSPSSLFTIGPDFPEITAASYTPSLNKMSLTFNKDVSVPAADVKYRVVVKKEIDGKWRWIKIDTFNGTFCSKKDPSCTFDFFVYKPGTTEALEAGNYRIDIQKALKEEGNPKDYLNHRWGPFGPLGGDFPVTPW